MRLTNFDEKGNIGLNIFHTKGKQTVLERTTDLIRVHDHDKKPQYRTRELQKNQKLEQYLSYI